MIDKHIMELMAEIYPLCRSITGDGVRKTLNIVKKYCPNLCTYEVPSGTNVMDWTIPPEWNIHDAFIKDEDGNTIIDFKENNLYVLGYSEPIDDILSLSELKKIVYTSPNQPDVIPYVTSYYQRRCGFCMPHKLIESLDNNKKYHVYIDSEFNYSGSLTYGEILIPGKKEEEIFLSTYICHPSMANNECSGIAVLTFLADFINNLIDRKYTYRIVFAPETIGAIAYISKNLAALKKVKAGYVITCVGDNNNYSVIHSRYGDNYSEKVLCNVLKNSIGDYNDYSYIKRGSDERQYCAPGVDLPICTFCRTKFCEYEEYHTSDDNLEFVSEEGLQGSFSILKKCISVFENNSVYIGTCLCEPKLDKRGLCSTISRKDDKGIVQNILDIFMYCDSKNDLVDISNITGIHIEEVIEIIKKLSSVNLIKQVNEYE